MFSKKLKEWKERQSELETKMAQYTKADESFYLDANILLNLLKRACAVFENSEISTKRQILNFVFQNTQLDGKKLVFKLKAPFDGVLDCQRFNDWLRDLDSNQDNILQRDVSYH